MYATEKIVSVLAHCSSIFPTYSNRIPFFLLIARAYISFVNSVSKI